MGVPATYLECTTLAALKAQMKGITDTTWDTALSQLITSTSLAIQNWIGAPLATGDRTEEYTVVPRQPFIFLRAYPVTAITAVRVSATWEYSAVAPMTASGYRVVAQTGQLFFQDELLEPDISGLYTSGQPMSAQVMYTAGFAATASALATAYPDIQTACHLWVAAIFKQREQPMALSERISETSVARVGELQMPEQCKQLLWPYRRIQF